MKDSTFVLGQQELTFRDHDESDLSVNRGNYVELIYLMVQRDELLKNYLAATSSTVVEAKGVNFPHK